MQTKTTIYIESKNLDMEKDFFFISNHLLAVPLKTTRKTLALIRVSDGTVMCLFSTLRCKFLFNNDCDPA